MPIVLHSLIVPPTPTPSWNTDCCHITIKQCAILERNTVETLRQILLCVKGIRDKTGKRADLFCLPCTSVSFEYKRTALSSLHASLPNCSARELAAVLAQSTQGLENGTNGTMYHEYWGCKWKMQGQRNNNYLWALLDFELLYISLTPGLFVHMYRSIRSFCSMCSIRSSLLSCCTCRNDRSDLRQIVMCLSPCCTCVAYASSEASV